MIDPYWFHKKWGIKIKEEIPMDDVYDRLSELETKVLELESKVKTLEEENIETTNELYRVENSLDARIDILAERFWTEQDV